MLLGRIDEEGGLDLRVRRTRYLLQQALMDLLGTQSFQSITVQAIAEQAMVNRATFYDHFADKYALLEYGIRMWFRQTLGERVPEAFTFSRENLSLLIATTCEFLAQLRHHCLPRDQELLPLVQTQITGLIEAILCEWLAEDDGAADRDAPPALTAAVTSWAIYGAAYHWSLQERQAAVEAFIPQALPVILASLGGAPNPA